MIGKVRITLWALVALAAIGFFYFSMRKPEAAPTAQASGEMPLVAIGGPFTLTGSDGKPFSSTRLNGRPYAIFFGFTHCPDVCPTTLARMTKLRKQLGKGDGAFDIVFVTVDPARDGPKEVGAYSGLFGTPIIGLTGTPDGIEKVKKQFAIYSEQVPMKGGDYTVNHTATVILMGKDGKFLATIAPEEGDDAALAKLKRLTA
nr:SCO family protein [uncultured Sphingomonas sp.]